MFLGVSALLFATCVTATVVWSRSMSAMHDMPMPGGWTMSMAWMRMPGQSWLEAAARFTAMWTVMMAAMMLPSLVPMLWRFRVAVGEAGESRPGGLTAIAAGGYFLVWATLGMIVYAPGTALAEAAMRSSAFSLAAPYAVGAVMVFAGALQFTPWKARPLGCCRGATRHGDAGPTGPAMALWHGMRLGFQCTICCVGPTAVLLVVGVMDVAAMTVVAAAITAERLAPAGPAVTRAIGFAASAAGLLVIVRTVVAI
jgi:predicted metal-binding membrane protein